MNAPIVSSKAIFVASNIAYIIFLFAAGHVGLVKLYKLGRMATGIAAAILTTAIVALFAWRGSHRFFPLAAGLLLWIVMGEMAQHLKIGDIMSIKNGLLILTIAVFVFYLVYKRLLPDFLSIAVVFFLTIWVSHFVLVSLFEQLGKTHIATYFSSLPFAALFAYSLIGILKESGQYELTVFSILIVCSFWSILEYLWAWKLLPKPF
jgi:hypothetical protein